jgi:hypothetical protein
MVAALALTAGCGGNDGGSAGATGPTVAPGAAATTSVSTTSTATTSVARTTSVVATSTTLTADPAPTSAVAPPGEECRRLEDFGPDAVERWFVVDDGVMGGRSQGTVTVADGMMRFAGTIETDGGGFSSVRTLVAPGALDGTTELRARVRTDGRAYDVIADDDVAGRDPRVSHFGGFPTTSTETWEEVVVPFAALEPRLFGTPVDDVPFSPELAVSLGVILADGTDGEFRFEVDWVDVCP